MSTTRRDRKLQAEMPPEYDFDYTRAQPNRFAARLRKNVVAVVLEPDVAQVFETSESVNRLLRSVISAVPKRRGGASIRKSRKAS